MQSKVVSFCQVLSYECRSIKKLNNSEHASACETLSEEKNVQDDLASDFQSYVDQNEEIEFPKQDHKIDEYVEGSSKPINFSALRDQHIEFTKNFFIKLKEDLDRRNRAKIKMVDFDHDKFKSKRFYFDCFVDGVATEGQLDCGADCSLLSRNVVSRICPKWKTFKDAGDITLTGVTGKELKVVSTKWLPISFSHEKIDEFMHPFVIVSEPDQFLLSSSAMYQELIGIKWDVEKRFPYLTWPDKSVANRPYFKRTPLFSETRYFGATNTTKCVIAPGQNAIVEFCTQQKITHARRACIFNVSDQNKVRQELREVVVSPSFSDLRKNRCVRAVVKNFSTRQISIPVGHLPCLVETERQENDYSLLDSRQSDFENDNKLATDFNHGQAGTQVYKIDNLPSRVVKYIRDIQSKMFVEMQAQKQQDKRPYSCLLYTSPSPRDATLSRMPSSA